MSIKTTHLTLGCGLIRIGRVWGVAQKAVPSDTEVELFLEKAFELGIRFFDTSPSYGLSEERFGKFVKNLTVNQRKEITIATKFGEHWNSIKQDAFVDHSYEALAKSLDQSFSRLGSIDILQLHKSSVESLMSPDVDKAFSHALSSGITYLGGSVSDVETGHIACNDQRLTYIQLPYNQHWNKLTSVIKEAKVNKKTIIFNRPYDMGALVEKTDSQHKIEKMIEGFKFIKDTNTPGVVLTGTASPKHLLENLDCFKQAQYE